MTRLQVPGPLPQAAGQLLARAGEQGRRRIAGAVSALFDADDPLAKTFDWPGDPGLFGPGSVSWEVIGDVSAIVGGIRALLVQALHPEVVAGVSQHSRYREDPLGRLGRTSAYVTATTFGALAEVDGAVRAVSRAHRPVNGTSHRGTAYTAADPDLLSWVHNVLTDSFLSAYQAYGPQRLSEADADRFVLEQTKVGELVGCSDLPGTAEALHTWVVHHPAIGPSPGLGEAVDFLRRPPLPLHAGIAYQALLGGAVLLIEPSSRAMIGMNARPGSRAATRAVLGGLRMALKPAGPSKLRAIERCALPAPDPGTVDAPGAPSEP